MDPVPHAAAPERRWNVVVVRPSRVGPGAPRRERPMLAFAGHDHDLTDRTAAALRAQGIEIVVFEGDEASLCPVHPTQLGAGVCARCRRRICFECQVAAGAALCAPCHDATRKANRMRRVRQLFALLVFAVFLTQAWTWREREQSLVDANGVVRVAFIQLIRPEAAGHGLISAMNHGGLQALAPWFEAERERYGGPDSPVLDVDVLGPWVATVNPPVAPGRDPGLLDQLVAALKFPAYFRGIALRHGVEPAHYGARVYIVYGDAQSDLAGDSLGSRSGRLAVSFVPVGDSTLAYAQVTVAHELAHILGAVDLYDPTTFRARFPEGYVKPWAVPAYPQQYAELMAVDRPISPSEEVEVGSLDDVRIGYRTAADLGWITAEQANRYYTPALTAPEAGLGPAPGVGGDSGRAR